MQNYGRVKSFVANQEDRVSLLNVMREIEFCDIIIDDGGHTMLQQQVTFGCLFPFIKSGGVYCIEDLHTSRGGRRMRDFNLTNTKNTTLKVLQDLFNDKTFSSDFCTQDEINYIKDNYSYCNIYKGVRSEIAFVGKND
jgi:hypothetical protein